MNYLFLICLLIISSSCTDYNPWGNNGSDEESEIHYLELDFHQLALANEDYQLRLELIQIEEELENDNEENQVRIEEIQIRRAVIEEEFASNADILLRGPIIGGGGLPPGCVPQSEFKPCPMPRGALENLWFSIESEEVTGIVMDIEGNIVGKIAEMQPVEETDGLFTKAIFEYDVESAHSIVIGKLNVMGEQDFTEYPLTNE